MTTWKPYQPAKNSRLGPDDYARAHQVTFITIRAYRGSVPFVSVAMNEMVMRLLCDEADRQQCAIHTYCLMPDHMHFLASPLVDGSSPLELTDRFKGRATNASWQIGWHGKLWQPRYYDHVVRAEEDLLSIARYILDNPVRKALVTRCEDWRWSGQITPLPL